MKKIMILLLLAILVVSGCGKETTGSNTESEAAASSDENLAEEPKGLILEEKIDQLGEEAIPLDLENLQTNSNDLHIFDKDGYTYVVQVNNTDVSSLGSSDSLSYSVDVSVLKDNKWIVKNKVTDLTDQVWDTKKLDADEWKSRVEVNNSEMYVFANTYYSIYTSTEQPYHQIHKLTFSSDGGVQDTKILDKRETTEGNFGYGIVNNFEQQYIYEEISEPNKDKDKYNILDKDGGVIATITNPGYNDDSNVNLTNDVKILNGDNIYFGEMDAAQQYNLKTEELTWNEDGSELEFLIADGLFPAYAPVKDGLYTTTMTGQGEYTLGFSEFNSEGTTTGIDAVIIPSDLFIKKAYISLDDENVYVYAIADFKGAASIQKYTYKRIDKN